MAPSIGRLTSQVHGVALLILIALFIFFLIVIFLIILLLLQDSAGPLSRLITLRGVVLAS